MKKDTAANEPSPEDIQAAEPEGQDISSEQPDMPETKTPEQELIENLQRLQAEFDNFRKRVAREQEEMRQAANDALLKELIPIIDNLHLSVQHAKDDSGTVKGPELLAGIIMINEQLNGLLERSGITKIPEDGRFNPHHHEALTVVAQEGAERGMVIQTYQRGYLRNGKVLRPARVSVAK